MPDIETRFCNNCQNHTDHTKIYTKTINGCEPPEDDYQISWSDTYSLFECNGCHDIHLEKVSWFSEWDDVETTNYPPRVYRKTPKWIDSVPENQKKLLEEIYRSLAANCKQLAVMGARTLIDLFILDKIGDIGNFEQKMTELQQKGFISIEQKKYLTAALDTGHAVIHRGFQPSDDIVNKVLDIIENLLINYSLNEIGDELNEITPKRNNKNDVQDNLTNRRTKVST